MGIPKSRVCAVRVSGPLAPFVAGYRLRLAAAGYTPLTIVNRVREIAHWSRWLATEGLTAGDVRTARAIEFLALRRAAGDGKNCSLPGLMVMIVELRDQGVIGEEVIVAGPVSPSEALLESFERYLLSERGLAAFTAESYVARARRFLAGRDGNLTGISGRDVAAAVRAEATLVSVGATQLFVIALRAFLRFLAVEGHVGQDLAPAALSLVGRRYTPLPQGISPADARLLLASCDRGEPDGRRDYAVILLLLRLGLRSTEVAELCLNDIDWHAGEITIRGKGRSLDRLPLPGDVGEAIVAYLRDGRPTTGHRQVFLRVIAPAGPLGRGGISCIVRYAAGRAGLGPMGAHRLRHTVACDMVAAGVPLPQIGQVLRHKILDSTAVYARVDIETLRTLALPWPQRSS